MLSVCALAMAVSGCTQIESAHGHVWREYQPGELTVGLDSRDVVAAKFGSPSNIGLNETETWIYIWNRKARSGADLATTIERRVVVVMFDVAGRVESVEEYGLEDGAEFEISQAETPTPERPIGLVQQLIGNLGRFE